MENVLGTAIQLCNLFSIVLRKLFKANGARGFLGSLILSNKLSSLFQFVQSTRWYLIVLRWDFFVIEVENSFVSEFEFALRLISCENDVANCVTR